MLDLNILVNAKDIQGQGYVARHGYPTNNGNKTFIILSVHDFLIKKNVDAFQKFQI